MLIANIMLTASIICFITGFIVIVNERFFNARASAKNAAFYDAEIKKLQASIEERAAESDKKDSHIAKLREQLQQMTFISSEHEQTKAENERLKQAVEESAKSSDDRPEKLKNVKSGLTWLQEATEQQKKLSSEMKQRIEENKKKMQLLNEKTKENFELIAKLNEK